AVQFTPPAGPQLAMPAGVLAIVPVPVLGGTVTVVATVTARGNCAVPLRLTVTGGTTVAPTTVVVGVRVMLAARGAVALAMGLKVMSKLHLPPRPGTVAVRQLSTPAAGTAVATTAKSAASAPATVARAGR